jgi:CubicO group peptidase (beta-lactamase class C family)
MFLAAYAAGSHWISDSHLAAIAARNRNCDTTYNAGATPIFCIFITLQINTDMNISFLPFHKLFMVCLFVSMAMTSCAQSTPYSKETEEKIRQVETNLAGWIQTQDQEKWTLKDRMTKYDIPAVSVAVIKDYKVEWAKAYGLADKEKNIPATVNTLFQAASLSKSVNAVGLLRLAQDKKIDLHTDINTYLSSWKFPYDSVSKNKKITVANLLSHTAGLTVHGFPGYKNRTTLPTVVQVLDGKSPANTKAVRSQFEPGLRSQYSGGGTTISQLIVADITRQAYDIYMEEKVLKPMGMTSSSYTQPPKEDKNAVLATAYRGNGKAIENNYHVYPEQAPAGLWTNPSDMARFIIETQLSYQGKSNKVLSREMTQFMLTPYIDKSAAMGVFIDTRGTDKYFQHGGANEGFRCQYFGSVENGNGVVVMVNSDNGSILSEIINSVAIVYGWKDFYKPVIKKLVVVADSVLVQYTGQYELGPQFIITITKEGSQLKAQATGQPSVDLFPETENKFFLKVLDAQVEFARENNMVTKLILYQNGTKAEGKKIK